MGEKPCQPVPFSPVKPIEKPVQVKYILTAGTVLNGVGGFFQPGFVEILTNDKIGRVGKLNMMGTPGANVLVINYGEQSCITPGLVDSHSHSGLSRSGGDQDDTNEASEMTAFGLSISGVWSDSFDFDACLKAGITTQFILPGSADIMGGFAFGVKNNSSKPTLERIIPGTIGIKLAFGENPKGPHNQQLIDTRQKEQAILIEVLNALKTGDSRMKYILEQPGFAAAVKKFQEDGDMHFHAHCYTIDDIIQVINAFEQVFVSGSEPLKAKLVLHHATEAYRIRNFIAERKNFIKGVAGWFDWGSFKIESDGWTFLNGAYLIEDGIPFSITSDVTDNLRMMREAFFLSDKARKANVPLPKDIALQMVTSIPAKFIRANNRIGQLTNGYDADIVVWSSNPLQSPYSNPIAVYVDGTPKFDYTKNKPLPICPYGLGRITEEDYTFNPQNEKIWIETGKQGELKPYSRPDNYSPSDTLITNIAVFTGDGETWYSSADVVLHKETGTLNLYKGGSVPINPKEYENIIEGKGRSLTPLLSETDSGIGLYVDAYNNTESRADQFGDARTLVDTTSPYFLTLLSNYGIGSAHITSTIDGSRGRFFKWNANGLAVEVQKSDESSTILYNLLNENFSESVQTLLTFLESDDPTAQQLISGVGTLLIGVNSAVNIREALRIAKKYPSMKVGLLGATSAWRFCDEIRDANVFVIRNKQYSTVELDDIPNDIGILLSKGVKTIISGYEVSAMTKLLFHAIEAIAYGANPHQVLNSVSSKPWEVFIGSPNVIVDGGPGSLVIWPKSVPISGVPDDKFVNSIQVTKISRPDLLAQRFK